MLKRGTILSLALLLVAGVGAEPTTQPTAPEAAVSAFIATANTGDVPKLVTMLADSDDDKVRGHLQRMADDLASGKATLTVLESLVEADVAAVIVKTTQGAREKPEAIPLAKLGDEWKLVMEPKNTGIDPDHMARLEEVLQRGKARARELRKQMAPARPTTQPAPQP